MACCEGYLLVGLWNVSVASVRFGGWCAARADFKKIYGDSPQ